MAGGGVQAVTEDHGWRGYPVPIEHCQGWAFKELVSGEQVGARSQAEALALEMPAG